MYRNIALFAGIAFSFIANTVVHTGSWILIHGEDVPEEML
jgi:hypothetical protein